MTDTCAFPLWLSAASLLTLLVAIPAYAETGNSKTACKAENAIYEAPRAQRDDFDPDTLRFDYDAKDGGIGPWTGWPKRATIHSSQHGRDFVFDTYFTNGSGKEGIGLKIPLKELDESLRLSRKPLLVDTDVFSIWSDLEVSGLPLRNSEAPSVILLPGFRHFAHNFYSGTISAGMGRAVFRFARCVGGESAESVKLEGKPDAQSAVEPDRRTSTDDEIADILGHKNWPPKPVPKRP